MNKRIVVFVLGTLFVGVTLFMIPFFSKAVLNVPNDAVHAPVYATTGPGPIREDLCTGCHSPKGAAPLPAAHSTNPRCLFCHPAES